MRIAVSFNQAGLRDEGQNRAAESHGCQVRIVWARSAALTSSFAFAGPRDQVLAGRSSAADSRSGRRCKVKVWPATAGSST